MVRTDSNALQWRHNEHGGVSNHQPHDCLPNRLFERRSKKTSKLRVTGLCEGNSPETGEFPAQRTSNAKNVSIWWRHHNRFNVVRTDSNALKRSGAWRMVLHWSQTCMRRRASDQNNVYVSKRLNKQWKLPVIWLGMRPMWRHCNEFDTFLSHRDTFRPVIILNFPVGPIDNARMNAPGLTHCGVLKQYGDRGARLTKDYDVTNRSYPITRKQYKTVKSIFAVYGFKILCAISKGTFEIWHKILNPYTAKYAFYKVVKFWQLKIS